MSEYKYLPARMAENLKGMNITVRRPVLGLQSGMHRSPHHGSSVEFAEYRAYVPGDPTNLIDWPVYARSDKYVIRRFQEETNLRAFVLLDTSASLGFRDHGAMTKMEYACLLASGAMYILVNQRDIVGLMTFDEQLRRKYKPVGSSVGLRTLLQALEDLEPSGRGDIEQCLHEAAGLIPPKSLVVVVSDFLQKATRIVRGIRRLHHDGHNILMLHVVDGGERRLSFGGITELHDMETRERLAVDVDEMREAYEAAVMRHFDELRRGCVECAADYRFASTSEPVESILRSAT